MAVPHLVALLLCCMAGVGRAQQATFAQRYPNNVGTADCPNQFSCLTTPVECVAIAVVRDCTDDCSNGADELCGVGEDRCNVDALPGVTDGVGTPVKACGNCFDPQTTDETILCLDRRYEATCSIDPLAFDCTNTVNCVPESFVLDGENDCFDKSDEDSCVSGRETLPQYPCDAAATCSWDATAATQAGETTCTCPAGFTGDGRKTAVGGTGCTGTTSTSTSTSSTSTSTSTTSTSTTTSSTSTTSTPSTSTSTTTSSTTTPTTSTPTSTSTTTESTTSTPTTSSTTTPTSSTSTSTSTSTTSTSSSTSTASTASGNECPGDAAFRCTASGECVVDRLVRDGSNDCADGSDETFCADYLSAPCASDAPCAYDANEHAFACGCPPMTAAESEFCRPQFDSIPHSCGKLQSMDAASATGKSDVYDVDCVTRTLAPQKCAYTAYCQQDVFGGGWTLVELRNSSRAGTSFNRTWADYRSGFGDPSGTNGDFWLGNDALNRLSRDEPQDLLVAGIDSKDLWHFARYRRVSFGDESTGYKLTLGPFFMGANGLVQSRNAQFSTPDRGPRTDCAAQSAGGWWYPKAGRCDTVNGVLTARIVNASNAAGTAPLSTGATWYSRPLQNMVMLVRPTSHRTPPGKPVGIASVRQALWGAACDKRHRNDHTVIAITLGLVIAKIAKHIG